MKTIISFFISLFLVSCTTPAVTDSGSLLPKHWLKSPTLDSTWGPAKPPSLYLNGRQARFYNNPNHNGSIIIIYEGQTPPREIRNADGTYASDGKLTIMGQTVSYYESGNEDPEISTQALHLTNPDGWSGYFTLAFSSPEHLKGKNIPEFTW